MEVQNEFTKSGAFGESIGPGLQQSARINREITRYAFCIGDHIEPTDKRQIAGAGLGGLYVSTYPNEGCPTLRRSRGLILRGAVVPLELVAVPKRADQRAISGTAETYIAGTPIRAQQIYPGDDMAFLLSDTFRESGVVEITPLEGKAWDTQLAQQVQKHFFPKWIEWYENPKDAPVLLSDWEDVIRSGRDNHNFDIELGAVIEQIGDQMLESARLFRQNALNYIERNRQMILSRRSADTGGMYVGWQNKSRLYAKQLGIILEDENKLANEAPVNSDSTDKLIAALAEDRNIRKEELAELKRRNDLLEKAAEKPKPFQKKVKTEDEQ